MYNVLSRHLNKEGRPGEADAAARTLRGALILADDGDHDAVDHAMSKRGAWRRALILAGTEKETVARVIVLRHAAGATPLIHLVFKGPYGEWALALDSKAI